MNMQQPGNIEHYKHFFAGTANMPLNRQFGLYSPTTDCFLLTSGNYDVIRTTSALFSSRMNTLIFNLSECKNFDDNLIDNSVCHKWSIVMPDDFSFFDNASCFAINKLFLGSLIKNNNTVDIFYFQRLLLTIHFYVEKLLFPQVNMLKITSIEEILNNLFDFPIEPDLSWIKLKKEIMSLLYLENNLDILNQKILEKLKPYNL